VGADGAIAETVSRDGLWAVQTPQAFIADVLRAAAEAGGEATDCAALVEARGGRVKVVPGDERLLKVTTTDDLAKVAQLRALHGGTQGSPVGPLLPSVEAGDSWPPAGRSPAPAVEQGFPDGDDQ
jgi:hypothetical protein